MVVQTNSWVILNNLVIQIYGRKEFYEENNERFRMKIGISANSENSSKIPKLLKEQILWLSGN